MWINIPKYDKRWKKKTDVSVHVLTFVSLVRQSVSHWCHFSCSVSAAPPLQTPPCTVTPAPGPTAPLPTLPVRSRPLSFLQTAQPTLSRRRLPGWSRGRTPSPPPHLPLDLDSGLLLLRVDLPLLVRWTPLTASLPALPLSPPPIRRRQIPSEAQRVVERV